MSSCDVTNVPLLNTKEGRKPRTHHAIPQKSDYKALWTFFMRHPSYFFSAVELDPEAGFDELGDLKSKFRYVSAALSVFFFFLNFHFIITVNVKIIWHHLYKGEGALIERPFLMTRPLMRNWFGIDVDAPAGIALLELSIGVGIYIYLGCLVLGVLKPKTETRKWMSVSNIFFWTVPLATKISAVKLLNWVTPQVITTDAVAIVQKIKFDGYRKNAGSLEWFWLSRIVCLFVGLDAFLFKFQMVAFLIHDRKLAEEGTDPSLILTALVFLNQMLGVVNVGMFTWQRLFVFVFGGEKGFLAAMGESKKRIWESMFVRELWKHQHLKWHEVLAIYLSFNDNDLQKLALDDKHNSRTAGDGSSCGCDGS